MKRPSGKKPDGLPLCGRRELVRSLAAMCVVGLANEACGPRGTLATAATPPGPTASRSAKPARGFGSRVALWSWFDLPDDPRSRELSGIAWDETSRTLWAVQDETANILSLIPDAELRKWQYGSVLALKLAFPLDLEGIVVIPDGFVVCSELGPRILELDRRGKLRRDIPLPEHFKQARANKSLESLSMSPDGDYLFTTSEVALSCDGLAASDQTGTLLRILRVAVTGGAVTEHAYVTDPAPHAVGDWGVADVASIGDDDLLVLERGWAPGYGNSARIYRVKLDDEGAKCEHLPSLASGTPVVAKTLVADLAHVATEGMPPAKQKQDSPLLDNFEGLAVGPRLPDGRGSLLLVSDDNGRTDQVARIVVLAVG